MRGIAKYVWFFLFIAFVGAFLLVDMSGLIGQSPVTASTAVAKVNGRSILYLDWQAETQRAAAQEEQRTGRSLNLDERRQLEDRVFDQMVLDVLLQQEYERRAIRVTAKEIQDAAMYAPPTDVRSNQSFFTDGQFDPEKYRRFIASPVAKQQGMLVQLEAYYRSEIPRNKLFSQLAADAWVSDERLFQMFKDERDSAQVSFVALQPTPAQVDSAAVSDAEARRFYDEYADRWDRAGRGVVSMVRISRAPTAADTAATRTRLVALREEITSGRSTFEAVAKRESQDSISALDGGNLGRGGRGRFVADFENAAYALRPGQVSEPVKTEFGWHLIKTAEKKGDSLSIRHILLRVAQGDSTATATDRRADRLSTIAAGQENPELLDSAAAELGLLVTQVPVQEGQPAQLVGSQVSGVSAWTFSGARVGDLSDLLDDDNGYYLARVDSLTPGGKQPVDVVRAEIVQVLKRRKAIDALQGRADSLLAESRASSLQAAGANRRIAVQASGRFNRLGFVPGIGYANEAVGAAFAIPIGGMGLARTNDGIVVMQVISRSEAARIEFEAQKGMQRERTLQGLREQRVRGYLDNLRRAAKVDDRRREINAMVRRQVAVEP